MAAALLFLILLLSPPFTRQADKTTDLHPKLVTYLNQQADSGFCFSALVAIDGDIVIQGGFGWVDSSRTIRANSHTLFNIASITKSFTATAIFSLVNKKLLNLNDTLAGFFPHVPRDKQSITLTQLLTHTSGFGQDYVSDGVTNRDSAVQHILNDTLRLHPGKDFSYSNENYELLGAIIELVTHQSYEDAIRTLVLRKGNLTDTRFWAESVGNQIIAPMNRKLDPAMLVRNWGYIGSGGIYSNVVDLYSWFTALNNGTILDSSSRENMWTVRRQLPETGIASGWFVSSSAGRREIWTRGNEDWGHNGVLRWFPESKVLIIVLSNSGERGDKNITANRYISDGIAKIIFP